PFAGVHPIVCCALVEHYRHEIVNCGDHGIRSARHDRERYLGTIFGRIPGLIQTREKEQATATRVNPERLPLGFRSDPFEKAISWYYATPLLKSIAEARKTIQRFGLRVDAHRRPAVVLRPTIDQSPARPPRSATFEFGSDDEVLIRWGNIEARSIAGRRFTIIVDAERVDDTPPMVPGQGKPSAHLTKPRPYDFSALKVIQLFQGSRRRPPLPCYAPCCNFTCSISSG